MASKRPEHLILRLLIISVKFKFPSCLDTYFDPYRSDVIFCGSNYEKYMSSRQSHLTWNKIKIAVLENRTLKKKLFWNWIWKYKKKCRDKDLVIFWKKIIFMFQDSVNSCIRSNKLMNVLLHSSSQAESSLSHPKLINQVSIFSGEKK